MHISSIRKHILQKRHSLCARTRYYASGLIMENLRTYLEKHSYRVLAGYFPLAFEPNLLPFLWNPQPTDKALVSIALPKITAKDHSLKFVSWEPNSLLQPGLFNIPTSQGELVTPDVILVPMVAYSTQGDRLGYGGGYYDRTLAEQRTQHAPLTIGINFDICELPLNYAPQEHDQRMSVIITDKRIIECGVASHSG